MNIVVFEDDRVESLYPITLARPVYSIQCGATRLRDLLGALTIAGRWWGVIRPHLQTLQREDDPTWHAAQQLPAEETLCVNGALVPNRAADQLIGGSVGDERPVDAQRLLGRKLLSGMPCGIVLALQRLQMWPNHTPPSAGDRQCPQQIA